MAIQERDDAQYILVIFIVTYGFGVGFKEGHIFGLCKFFADQGYLPFREPIKKLIYHGYINAPDGKKMSKSKGNVIDPLDVINDGYGADTLRTYEMFIGPVELDAAWDPRSVGGVYRFLSRCWTLCFGRSVDIPSRDASSRLPLQGSSLRSLPSSRKIPRWGQT